MLIYIWKFSNTSKLNNLLIKLAVQSLRSSITRIQLINIHSTEEISIGNLNLVDLAGSKRLKSKKVVIIT